MMSSGSFESDSELAPRMRMRFALPWVPPGEFTYTPGAEACRTSAMFVVVASRSADGVTVATVLPVSRLRWDSPVAVTTTSSIWIAVAARTKFAVAVPPAVTATDWVTGA